MMLKDATYALVATAPKLKPLVEVGCKLMKSMGSNYHVHIDIPRGALGIGLWGLIDRIRGNSDFIEGVTISAGFNSKLRVRRPLPKPGKPRAARVTAVKLNRARKIARIEELAKIVKEAEAMI